MKHNFFLNKFFEQRLPTYWLVVIIIIGHVHAILFYGATFGVDAQVYIILSQLFESAQKAQTIIADPKLWIYTDHIPLGEPFVWYLVSKLPTSAIWPALAFLQHFIGAVSQIYLFSTLNTIRSRRLLVIPCVLMSFFPFYQTMHNSLLTEAISGACFLVAMAACLRLAHAPRKRDYVYLALSGLGAFFRVYIVTAPLFGLFLLFSFRKIRFMKAAALGCLCILGLTLSSAWIFGMTGQLWVPNFGLSAMWDDSIHSPATPAAVTAYADTLPWPDEATKQRLFSGDFRRFEAIAVSSCWAKSGMTKKQAMDTAQKISTLFREQPGQWKRQLTAALVCMGIPEATLLPRQWQHGRHPELEKERTFRRGGDSKYFSWITPDEPFYNTLTSMPWFPDTPGHSLFKAAWKPYLKFSTPERVKDIFGLSHIPLGIWALLGLGACVFMLARGNTFPGILFTGLFLIFFSLFYSINIPMDRYSYHAVLLYFTAISTAVAMQQKKKLNV